MSSCWQLIPTCDTPTLQSLLSSATLNGTQNTISFDANNNRNTINMSNLSQHSISAPIVRNSTKSFVNEMIKVRQINGRLRDRCATKDQMINVLEAIRDKLEFRCQQLMDMCECKNYALVECNQHNEEVNDLYSQYAKLKLNNDNCETKYNFVNNNNGNTSATDVLMKCNTESGNKCKSNAISVSQQSTSGERERERPHDNLPILKSMLTSRFKDTIVPKAIEFSPNQAMVTNTMYDSVLDDSRPHKCFWPECRFATRDRKTLRTHERIHTNEKPYKCVYPNCNYATGDPSNYRKHRRRHTNAIKLVCDVSGCNFTAFRADSMVKHRALHIRNKSALVLNKQRWHFERIAVKDNRERLIVCNFPNCGKRFINDAGLAGHQITHRNHQIVSSNFQNNSSNNKAIIASNNKSVEDIDDDDDVIILNF